MSNKAQFTYEFIKAAIDCDGWRKCWLKRSDGRQVKVNGGRYGQLIRENRITNQTP